MSSLSRIGRYHEALFQSSGGRAYLGIVLAEPHQDLPIPVTAKLSKLFYERLGEQLAGELVDWFNSVDATYRNDLQELNELNFARFDAKLERRIAQVEATIEMRFEQLRAEVLGELAKLDAKLERRPGEQTRWLVGIWLTVILAAVAIWIRK